MSTGLRYGNPPPPCRTCGEQTQHYLSAHCKRCKKLHDRFEFRGVGRPDKEAWERALAAAYDRDAGVFRCHYTGVALVYGAEWWPHPRYLDREHQNPSDESSVVVCCSIVNQMNGAMLDPEVPPGDGRSAAFYRGQRDDQIVLETQLLIDRVKGDLGPDTLRAMVLALEQRFRGEPFDAHVFELIEPGR